MPPKQTQQPLPLLLSPSFFYGEFSMANTLYNPCTHCTVGHTIIYTMKRQMSSALYAQTTFAFSSQIFLLSIQNSLLTIFTKLPLINTYILYCTSTWVQNYPPPPPPAAGQHSVEASHHYLPSPIRLTIDRLQPTLSTRASRFANIL